MGLLHILIFIFRVSEQFILTVIIHGIPECHLYQMPILSLLIALAYPDPENLMAHYQT